jgi:hypothetical protein
VIAKLQSLTLFSEARNFEFSDEVIKTLNEHVDILYVTILPNIAIRLTEHFRGPVIFRPFGQGTYNNYTEIISTIADIKLLEDLRERDNYIWCPILSTLQDPEDQRLWKNPLHLCPFVTPQRLTRGRWRASDSEPIVVETIPRINKQTYYREIYENYVSQLKDLPLRILGNNQFHGGELADERILGFLDDDAYYSQILSARISIYHGTSPYHLHYHPLEYMALGVPVLFHQDSALAEESRGYGLSETELFGLGMFRNFHSAAELATRAIADSKFAEEISQRQRFFGEELYSRRNALIQARWLRAVCAAKIAALTKEKVPVKPEMDETVVRPWSVKVQRELARFTRRIGRRWLSPQDIEVA